MFFSLSGKTFYLPLQKDLLSEIRQLLDTLQTKFQNFIYYSGGKPLTSFENLSPLTTIHATIPLMGGKGGYGAKLKTEGGKKIKPNDNMFSRDMSGQRLVYATMQRQFRQFVIKKHQEDKKVAQERQQFKIMENTLKEGQSFMKLDKTYKKQIEQTEKNLVDSIEIGKQKVLQKLKKQQQEKKEQQENKEEQKEIYLGSEENKQQELGPKRNRPQQTQGDVKQSLTKKVKLQQQVKQVTHKPAFLSAQERFKALFKK